MLTQAELKEYLHYNPETGIFTRIKRTSNRINIGDIVWCLSSDGYNRCSIEYKYYKISRLAFLYMTGKFPINHVDHINGIRHDDRWINLREANPIESSCNTSLRIDSTTGIKGLHFKENIGLFGTYQAYINYNKKRISKTITLRSGSTIENERVLAKLQIWLSEKRKELHKEFSNHGT